MSTPQEQVQCMLWIAELQSLLAVQRHFRTQYGHQPPTRESIQFWDNKLRTTDHLLHVKSPGKTWTSEEHVNYIWEAFQQGLRKSVRAAILQLQNPHSTLHDVLHKRLCLRAYKIQMVHALKLSDQVACTNFAVGMPERIEVSPDFLLQVCFSDKATLSVSEAVNRYYCRIWGSENQHVTCKLQRGSPKVNVWAGLIHNKLIGPFWFSEKIVTGRSYLDMLELYALPQLSPQTILQQDGEPPHFCHHVRNHLAGRW
jgi:hypothetical protein